MQQTGVIPKCKQIQLVSGKKKDRKKEKNNNSERKKEDHGMRKVPLENAQLRLPSVGIDWVVVNPRFFGCKAQYVSIVFPVLYGGILRGCCCRVDIVAYMDKEASW